MWSEKCSPGSTGLSPPQPAGLSGTHPTAQGGWVEEAGYAGNLFACLLQQLMHTRTHTHARARAHTHPAFI